MKFLFLQSNGPTQSKMDTLKASNPTQDESTPPTPTRSATWATVRQISDVCARSVLAVICKGASRCRGAGRVLFGWTIDVRKRLAAKDGWELIAKTIVFFVAAAGLIIGIQTYQTQVRVSQIQGANEEFARLVNDFTDGTEQNRIWALARAPAVMRRVTPASEATTLQHLLEALWGASDDNHRPHLADVRRLVSAFASRGNAVTYAELDELIHDDAMAPPKDSARTLSPEEAESLIEFLVTVGRQGWYYGHDRENPTARPQDAITWVWKALPLGIGDGRFTSPTGLFSGTTITGLRLRGYDLSNAEFRFARLINCDFSNVRAAEVRFDGSILHSADFSHATLSDASFENSSLWHARCGGAVLTNANFQFADLRYSTLHDARIEGATFFNARLDHATLTNVNGSSPNGALPAPTVFRNSILTHAFFANARLNNAVFSHAELSQAVFTHCHLRGADFSHAVASDANLSYTQLHEAKFHVADLTNADFTGAKGVLAIDSWQDANIAGVKGLDSGTVGELITRGAVQIENPEKWHQYKLDGRPHEKWEEYSTTSPSDGKGQ
jgi:uncharacterized protein YjbI with pentapeptide repeats